MSDRSPISILDAATRAIVSAALIDDVSDDELRAADRSWVPIRYQAALANLQQREEPASHSHWQWARKTGPARTGRRILGIECQGEIQALAALRLDKTCRLPEQIDQPLVYVDYIESAPWNLVRYVPQPRYRGCGLHLIRAAVELSFFLGWAGRLSLHSLEETDTLAFYRNVCGMSEMEPDPAYGDLRYFEMTEARADAFFKKRVE